jgi:hypothetical protein
MVDLTQVDALIQRHEMGVAYKAITAKMGPSPQLVAFVNYDRVTSESVGLESFDIMDQHQQILAEIDGDVSMQMATEGMVDGIKKYRKWLIGGGIVLGIPAGFGLLSIGMILTGATGIYLKSQDGNVPTVSNFTALTKAYGMAYRAESLFINAIPTTLDAKAWAAFNENYIAGDLFEADETAGEARHDARHDTVAFKKSGWTVDSFKNATKWLIDNQKKVKALNEAQAAKLDKVEKLMAGGSGGAVVKDVSKMLKVAHASTHESAKILEEIEAILRKVATHFAPKSEEGGDAKEAPVAKTDEEK